MWIRYSFWLIIPISKLLGNYNSARVVNNAEKIIPISKLLGNYNGYQHMHHRHHIIPISKLLGNYNRPGEAANIPKLHRRIRGLF